MLTKNPQYNPNDPNSKRWVTPAAPITAAPTSISQIFAPFVDPFKKVLSTPATPAEKPNTGLGINMSVDQNANKSTPANMSIAPKTPVVVPGAPAAPAVGDGATANPQVLAEQKRLNALGAGLVEDGIMGAKTQAAQAKFGAAAPIAGAAGVKPTLPLDSTGAINYAKLAEQAGAAGLSLQDYVSLVQGQAAPGTKEYEDIYTKLGIPDLVTSVYSKPAKTTQSIYEDYYNSSGLADVKNKIASLDTELKTIRDGYTQAQKEHQDNPWLSASTRSAKIAREKELYGQKEANAIALRTSYLDQYNLGVDEVEKIVGRVGGDLELDRSLNADKLNYLLNEAERKAGLTVTDATKAGLRYSGDYLTSRKKEKLAEENRAFDKQVKLEKIKSGADIANAIATLSTKSPTAGGYFSALNNVLAIKDSTPEKSKLALKTLTGYLADGNESQAREYLQQLALGSLSGTDRSDAMKRTASINALNAVKEKLNTYAEKYGDTNLLTGTIQNIQQTLGTAGNADAAELNTELTKLLQSARVETTGAAWGAQEDKEYAKVNANLKNTRKLNMAIIDANLDILNRNNASSIEWVLGKDTYDKLYRPTITTKASSVPSLYATADQNTKTAIDKMVADGIPEATILQIFNGQ